MPPISSQSRTLYPDTAFILGTDLIASLSAFVQKLKTTAIVICDEALKQVAEQIPLDYLTFPSGEKSKTRAMKERLEDELLSRKLGRGTAIIALGGGVATDLVGFLASTYMRGVPLILVPTTLLAMVDAAIGGKTSVDTPHAKNLIGTFYPPKAIFADLNFLKTLPEKEWRCGLAEIWKAALIADPHLWQLPAWRKHLPEVIDRAVNVKAHCIEQDFSEKGLRRILNFGHTIGHGLEAIADYCLSHGEAIALGIIVESYLSHQLGYLSASEFEDIQTRFQTIGFTLKLPKEYNRGRLLEAMSHDKKSSGHIRFTLIDKIGHAMPFDGEYCRAISPAELNNLLHWMETHYG